MGNGLKYIDGYPDITLDGDGVVTFSNIAAAPDGVDVGRSFDRFFTVEAARSSTGPRLSIARSLVLRMKGPISAEYTDGVLCIRICLPQENKYEQAKWCSRQLFPSIYEKKDTLSDIFLTACDF